MLYSIWLLGRKSPNLLFAKDNWGVAPSLCRIEIARCVVPLAFIAVSQAIQVSTLFNPTSIVWLAAWPSRVTFCQWSVINPVQLVVRLADKTKPHSPWGDGFLFPEQGECEVILSSWFYYSEVSSKHLTSSSSIAPFHGWNVDDEVTEVAEVNPTILRTNWKKEKFSSWF